VPLGTCSQTVARDAIKHFQIQVDGDLWQRKDDTRDSLVSGVESDSTDDDDDGELEEMSDGGDSRVVPEAPTKRMRMD
jgi:hypothetical protein